MQKINFNGDIREFPSRFFTNSQTIKHLREDCPSQIPIMQLNCPPEFMYMYCAFSVELCITDYIRFLSIAEQLDDTETIDAIRYKLNKKYNNINYIEKLVECFEHDDINKDVLCEQIAHILNTDRKGAKENFKTLRNIFSQYPEYNQMIIKYMTRYLQCFNLVGKKFGTFIETGYAYDGRIYKDLSIDWVPAYIHIIGLTSVRSKLFTERYSDDDFDISTGVTIALKEDPDIDEFSLEGIFETVEEVFNAVKDNRKKTIDQLITLFNYRGKDNTSFDIGFITQPDIVKLFNDDPHTKISHGLETYIIVKLFGHVYDNDKRIYFSIKLEHNDDF